MTGRLPLPLPLLLGCVAFLGVVVLLMAGAFVRHDMAAFAPDPPRPDAARHVRVTEDTITIDARDPARWRFVDLDRGAVLQMPDTVGWDLAARRFHLTASGEVAVAGARRFDEVLTAPSEGYRATAFATDTVNAALARWYRYSFLSHLLHPLERVWVLRTPGGRYVKFTVLSYYCPGLIAGCMTIRYAYQPDGSGTFR